MRQAQKAQTRQRVLEAAQGLFATRGFERTTISAIARAAEVSVGTVHAHFDDKVSLLAASLYDEIERRLDMAWRGGSGPALDRLEHAARTLYAWYAEDPDRSRTLLKHTMFLEGPWGDRFDAQMARFVAEVAGVFAEAEAAGTLGHGGPPDLIAAGFMGDYLAVLVGGLKAAAFDVDAQVAALMALTRLRCGLTVRR